MTEDLPTITINGEHTVLYSIQGSEPYSVSPDRTQLKFGQLEITTATPSQFMAHNMTVVLLPNLYPLNFTHKDGTTKEKFLRIWKYFVWLFFSK